MKEKVIYIICYLLFTSVASYANTVYYVDNLEGSDLNSGQTPQKAWRSLEKVNNTSFRPGDRVYLKRGRLFEGYLYLKGTGQAGNPILIGAYGSGHRPMIQAKGYRFGLMIMDADNWEVRDLEINGSDMAGLFIGCTKDGLKLNHIRIYNCLVQHIGDTAKVDWDLSRSSGGIIVVNGNLDKEGKPVFYNSVFNDVQISNCTVKFNHRWTSISISSGKLNGRGGNNNIIRNCTAAWSAADGIRMNGVSNSRIEYCVMYRNGAWPNYPGKNLGGLGAWFFDADSCTIQYCEAGYVQAATTDGGAFDIDYWQTNSTVQYSYGHHCAGYGVSVFGADPSRPTKNSVVRYNILKDNGRDSAFAYQGDFYVFTWGGGLLNGVKIHDNISYWNPASSAPSLKFHADLTGDLPNSFTNNTIYSLHPWLVSFKSDSLKSDSNTYWISPGKPVWSQKNNNYHSLEDWQKNTGLDRKSAFVSKAISIPDWYKAGVRSSIKFKPPDSNAILEQSSKPGNIHPGTDWVEKYRGNLVLLSYICLQSDLSQTDKEVMEAQLVFIKSMKRQYEDKGLKLLLVEASGQTGPGLQNSEIFGNLIRDHELEDVLFITDKEIGGLSGKFGAGICPTTFLLSGDGTVLNKWSNLVLPASMAFAIDDALKTSIQNKR